MRQFTDCRMRFVLTSALLSALAVTTHAAESKPWKVPTRHARKVNPQASDAGAVSAGKALYQANCVVCHGEKGKGDGVTAAALQPKPANFGDKQVWDQSDGSLFYKISKGRAPMPAFEDALTKDQRWQLVSYIRRLMPQRANADRPAVSSKPTTSGHGTAKAAGDPAHTRPAVQAPLGFRKAVSKVMAAYRTLHGALSRDDLGGARTAATAIGAPVAELSKADSSFMSAAERSDWSAQSRQLATRQLSLSGAKDLDGLRTSFKLMSEALAQTVQKYGHAEGSSLRVVKCPMADKGKGATWLQSSTNIANPYMASSMPTCGQVQAVVSATK